MYRKFVQKLNAFNKGVLMVERWICFILMAIFMFCLVAQVIARFILKVPAAWTEEMARYSFVACVFIACGFTLHHGKHVEMNLLDSYVQRLKNPSKGFFIIKKFTMAANMVFCGWFISLYFPFLMKIRRLGKTAVTVEILPMWVVMSSVLIGMILMFWHSLVWFLQYYEESVKEDIGVSEQREAK